MATAISRLDGAVGVGQAESELPIKASATAGSSNPGDEALPGTPGTGEDIAPVCNGSGQQAGQTCSNCGGSGKIIEGIGGG